MSRDIKYIGLDVQEATVIAVLNANGNLVMESDFTGQSHTYRNDLHIRFSLVRKAVRQGRLSRPAQP